MNESLSTGLRKTKILFKCVTQDKTPVILSGSASELGEWDLKEAAEMLPIPRPQGGFEWTASIELPLGHTIEYKFLKKAEHGPRWESGNNHRITVIQGVHTLHADFRE